MSKALLLKLHRWITLVLALPLLIVIGTGLILSVQPILQEASIRPGSLTQQRLEGLIRRFDPNGEANSLSIDPVEQRLTLYTPNRPPVAVDLATGEAAQTGPGLLSRIFAESRRIHERLLFGLAPLVPISTGAMIVLAALGVLMGWPRLSNDLYGWHKAIGWGLLPLVVVSPLTGLAITYGVTFTSPMPRTPSVPLMQAVKLASAATDPSNLLFIAQRGGRQMVRTMENGAVRGYAIAPDGLRPLQDNWPRLIHEGNWSGIWGGLINAITAAGMLGLLGTGLLIWAKRQFRRRRPRPAATVKKQAAEAQ